jgi:hypothetical protein
MALAGGFVSLSFIARRRWAAGAVMMGSGVLVAAIAAGKIR